jgi:DNA-binding NarL/FixJ family response regulator
LLNFASHNPKTKTMTRVDKTYQQGIRSIFITDDDEDDQGMLKDALKDISPAYKIETFRTCAELFAMLEHFTADMLFVDLDMPGKNGLQCIKDIKANDTTAKVPIVVFSSTSRESNIEVAYQAGAHLFMVKPSSYFGLINTLRKVLSLDWSIPEEVKSNQYINEKYLPFA